MKGRSVFFLVGRYKGAVAPDQISCPHPPKNGVPPRKNTTHPHPLKNEAPSQEIISSKKSKYCKLPLISVFHFYNNIGKYHDSL